jgi:hypothetical protein
MQLAESHARPRAVNDGWSAERAFDEIRKYEFEKGLISHNRLRNLLFDFYKQSAAAQWPAPGPRDADTIRIREDDLNGQT